MSEKKLRSAIKTLGKAMNKLEELVDLYEEPEPKDPTYETRNFTEEENFGLPLPRLECRSFKTGDSQLAVVCYLVRRHYSGDISAAVLSWTKCDLGRAGDTDKPYEPFRDGANIRYDAVAMNLPAYFVHENGQHHRATSFQEYFGREPSYIGEKK